MTFHISILVSAFSLPRKVDVDHIDKTIKTKLIPISTVVKENKEDLGD